MDLPSLAERHQVPGPCAGKGHPAFSPTWIGWSPTSDSYAIAWGIPHTPETGAHVQLRFYSTGQGSLQGDAKLWWQIERPHAAHAERQYQLHIHYQWMSQGDCIVVTTDRAAHPPKDVATVIACTGEVLQTIHSDYWTRRAQVCPSGEYMDLYGNDPDGDFADPTVLSLHHLRSGRIISSKLPNTETALTGSTLWHRTSEICTNMADYRESRQIVVLSGRQDAHGTFCELPGNLHRNCRACDTACFSPFSGLLLEVVQSCDGGNHLAQWTWSTPGVAADLHMGDLEPFQSDRELNVANVAWHPSPSAEMYALLDRDQYLHLISGKTHSRLTSWTADSIFGFHEAGFRNQTLEWSPDGSQLMVASGGASKAAVFLFA